MTALATLFKFEEQLESGFSALLDSITTNVYYRRSTETKATPFIDVLVTVGSALQHERDQTTNTDEDIYEATVQIVVVTNRSTSGQNTSHHTLLGKVRAAMLPSSGSFNSTNFGDLAVLDVFPTGSGYDTDQDTNIDATALDYAIVFGIRDTAWPVA